MTYFGINDKGILIFLFQGTLFFYDFMQRNGKLQRNANHATTPKKCNHRSNRFVVFCYRFFPLDFWYKETICPLAAVSLSSEIYAVSAFLTKQKTQRFLYQSLRFDMAKDSIFDTMQPSELYRFFAWVAFLWSWLH
ncbi:MAG: hypothetical protein NC177_16150 [Ruminococcus flavefaciens]|nr:hypothetical protein [Ruminococcus flavefaciens]